MSKGHNLLAYGPKQKFGIFDWIMMIALVVASAIVPLLVRVARVDLDALSAEAYTGAKAYMDIFNFWKSQYLLIIFILALIYWLVRIYQRYDIRVDMIFIPLAVYTLMVVLSTVFATYKSIAANGYPDRLEGAYSLLSYVMIAWTAAMLLTTEKRRGIVLTGIIISSVVLAVLGATQYLGYDFFKTDAGRDVMVPRMYEELKNQLDFNFGKNIMYTTVYNPNYLGSYSALLLPIAVGMVYAYAKKPSWRLALAGVFVISTFILWIGGMSRAGLLGGAAAAALFVILGFKTILRQWKATVGIILVIIVLFIGMNQFSEGAVVKEFINTMPSSIAGMLQNDEKPAITDETTENTLPPKPLVKSATLADNKFRYETETETIVVWFLDEAFQIFDGNENRLNVTMTATPTADGKTINEVIFTDAAYQAYKLVMVNNGALLKWHSDISIPLIVIDGQLTVNVKERVYATVLDKPETIGFKGRELFASSRGYIWSRSIPLLKDTIIIGHGPDTYAAYFPQNEIDAKINYLFSPNRIVDKPHNWYLQLGINTGVISLLAMLIFLGWYLIKAFSYYRKESTNEWHMMHVGIICGIVGYLIAAVFNDSNVSVSPVFWTVLGIGLSYIVHSEKKNIQKG